jgi:hypothetical protein
MADPGTASTGTASTGTASTGTASTGIAGTGMAGTGAAPGGVPKRRAVRTVSLVVLATVGLAAVAAGGLGLSRELTRKATKAEVAAALSQEIATRWRRLPAGKIFPATIRYQETGGDTVTATRAGIAPPTSCRASLEPGALRQLQPLGCTTMLRATYLSASGSYAATVGIGVMASQSAAASAYARLNHLAPAAGLYAVPFAGTIAGGFGNAARGKAGVEQEAGPYIFLYTAGYTDGIPGHAIRADEEPAVLGIGLLSALVAGLTGHGQPCSMRDIRC